MKKSLHSTAPQCMINCTCETRHEKDEAFHIKWMKHYESTSLEVMFTCPYILTPQPYFHKPPHAAWCLALKSEETSVSLRLLETDKSLTSVSGPQAAYIGHSLDIWQAHRTRSPSTVTSENMPPNIKLSQSQGAADSEIQGPAVVILWYVLCGVAKGEFTASVIKKIRPAYTGQEQNNKIGCKFYFIAQACYLSFIIFTTIYFHVT